MPRRPGANSVSNHREIDPLISNYQHEKQRPREAEALEKLKKIASLVKPLMRARNWRVGTLTEFYPNEQNLLGLNKNRGQEILLRLRYAGDANQFMPMEQVVDTMLHELSHNVFGPHDAKFHALWDELRTEYEGLISKGYTGEGFLSEGKRLGGRSIPVDEARRIRRIAAEKRAVLSKGSGQKLGGAPVPRGTDIRKVIVDAIERRNRITQGCASGGNKDEAEVEAISNRANQNGFKTQAEEDEANEAAIAQALWDLHQEDQKKKYGNDYVPPTMAGGGSKGSIGRPATAVNAPDPSPEPETWPNPEPKSNSPVQHRLGLGMQEQTFGPPSLIRSKQSGSASSTSDVKASKPVVKSEAVKSEVRSPKPTRSSTAPRTNLIHSSRLVQPPPSKRPANPSTAAKPSKPTAEKTLTPAKFWTCPVCTFAENPILHLCCDVCTTEQPDSVSHVIAPKPPANAARPATTTQPPPNSFPKTWRCHGCANEMENQWWTCSYCGTMRLTSKDMDSSGMVI